MRARYQKILNVTGVLKAILMVIAAYQAKWLIYRTDKTIKKKAQLDGEQRK